MLAYIDLVEKRDHDSAVKSSITTLRYGTDLKLSTLQRADGQVKGFLLLVFAQLGKVGLLEAPVIGARFYTGLAGVFATLDAAKAGKFDDIPISTKTTLLVNELALWTDTISKGRATIALLDKNAR